MSLAIARQIILDFYRRLCENGADPEKVRRAVFKVGRLLAMQTVLADRLQSNRCRACSIHEEEPDALQHSGSGNPSADIVFVGQGAGETEGQFGLPFVGIAGTLLTMALEEAGTPRETVWLTNVIQCRPKGNRAPYKEECQACISARLEKEVQIIKPKIIVALGAAALKAMVDSEQLGSAGITKHRGRQFTTSLAGCSYPVLATFHPAYIVRKYGSDFAKTYTTFVSDIMLARRLSESV